MPSEEFTAEGHRCKYHGTRTLLKGSYNDSLICPECYEDE